MDIHNYPSLTHLLGSYLHQDWREEYRDTTEAVLAFIADEGLGTAAATSKEITALFGEPAFHQRPDSVLIDLGCCYNTGFTGQTPQQWLLDVQRLLEQSLRGPI